RASPAGPQDAPTSTFWTPTPNFSPSRDPRAQFSPDLAKISAGAHRRNQPTWGSWGRREKGFACLLAHNQPLFTLFLRAPPT
uniref:Uncharacterized protein n=1 Tax=Aegilops tauschii subsp. strangulata TaxID=200361 RepID=A0A453BEF3_AEGTS